PSTRVVVDLLDPRDQSTVALYQRPLTVVSTALVANYMVQLSREPKRAGVFRRLIASSDGAELYAREPDRYFRGEPQISFRTIGERARRLGEVAIGFKGEGGLELSPADPDVPLSRDAVDVVIVVADD
ncbi:MAG: hypothetical protein VX938_04400, partial [Myxococcota bacterium]|nr:hypothetical protein [Myxococcota bacterium]